MLERASMLARWTPCMLALACGVVISRLQCVRGTSFMTFECEILPIEDCAFAVGYGGFRCVLETAIHIDGAITYECKTLRLELQIQFGGSGFNSLRSGYIESDDCVNACGLKRMTVGISTDELFQNNIFREKLCSPKCKENCFNIIDHYNTIMAEEGEDLTRICDELFEYIQHEKENQYSKALLSTTVRNNLASARAAAPSSRWT